MHKISSFAHTPMPMRWFLFYFVFEANGDIWINVGQSTSQFKLHSMSRLNDGRDRNSDKDVIRKRMPASVLFYWWNRIQEYCTSRYGQLAGEALDTHIYGNTMQECFCTFDCIVQAFTNDNHSKCKVMPAVQRTITEHMYNCQKSAQNNIPLAIRSLQSSSIVHTNERMR